MLENLLATGSALAPFFVYLILGMLLKRWGVIDDELAAAINSLIFKVFLPVNFFKSIYTADLSGLFGAAAVPYVMIATLIIMFALMKISKKLTDDPAKQGALVHTGYQGNFMMFSLPIAQRIAGDAPQVLLILTGLLITVNFTSIPLMEHYRSQVRIRDGRQSGEEKTSFVQLLIRLLRVPLVDSVILGLIWSVCHIPMPAIGRTVVSGIAGCVVPLAFVVMGAKLDLAHIRANSGLALRQVAIKLIAIPALVMIVPVAAGWDSASIATIIAAFGAPSAVVSVSTCGSYECDEELAGEIVTLTSFLALFTVFVWLFCFRQAGFIGQ